MLRRCSDCVRLLASYTQSLRERLAKNQSTTLYVFHGVMITPIRGIIQSSLPIGFCALRTSGRMQFLMEFLFAIGFGWRCSPPWRRISHSPALYATQKWLIIPLSFNKYSSVRKPQRKRQKGQIELKKENQKNGNNHFSQTRNEFTQLLEEKKWLRTPRWTLTVMFIFA